MGGWVLDVFIVYLYKALARSLQRRGSTTWAITKATVESAYCPPKALGCPTAEVVYTYAVEQSIYSGMNEKPFVLWSSAEDYAARYTPRSTLVVRLKPSEPETSIVRDEDQTQLAGQA